MQHVGISTYQFILCYASTIHKHMCTRILRPFEDSEPTGLKVDIAKMLPTDINDSSRYGTLRHLCWLDFVLEIGVRIIVHSWSINPDVIIIWSWSLDFYEHIDTIWNWSGVEWTDRLFSRVQTSWIERPVWLGNCTSRWRRQASPSVCCSSSPMTATRCSDSFVLVAVYHCALLLGLCLQLSLP